MYQTFVSTALTPTLLPLTPMSTPVRTSEWQILIHCLSELPLQAGALTCPLPEAEGEMKFMTVASGQESAKEVGLNVFASLSLLTEETQSFKLENILHFLNLPPISLPRPAY